MKTEMEGHMVMEMDSLEGFQKYLGKVLEIEYCEKGDDDEGYGWSYNSKRKVVLDGIVREELKESRFFLVGHDEEMDLLISPHIIKPVNLQLSNWGDFSDIAGIRCNDMPIDVVLPISPVYEKHSRYDLGIDAKSRPRRTEHSNYFLSSDYLAQNRLKVLMSV